MKYIKKLTIQTPEPCSSVFIVNFEQFNGDWNLTTIRFPFRVCILPEQISNAPRFNYFAIIVFARKPGLKDVYLIRMHQIITYFQK